MPPLICPSPIILDQSFPRDQHELGLVAVSLGVMAELVQEEKAYLLLTNVLSDFVLDIDWNRLPGPQGLLREIYILFNQWFLQPHDSLVVFDVSEIADYKPHPLPQGCEGTGLIEFWSDELGRILFIHDSCCSKRKFFVGVACAYAFAGEKISEYNNPNNDRAFPLVGPNNLDQLDDAYYWNVPQDIHRRNVSIDDFKKHCHILDGTYEAPRSGSSHHKVRFKGGRRSWVLDTNVDPIPDRFLQEIVDITGKSLKFIKFVLINGKNPDYFLKLKQTKPLNVTNKPDRSNDDSIFLPQRVLNE